MDSTTQERLHVNYIYVINGTSMHVIDIDQLPGDTAVIIVIISQHVLTGQSILLLDMIFLTESVITLLIGSMLIRQLKMFNLMLC